MAPFYYLLSIVIRSWWMIISQRPIFRFAGVKTVLVDIALPLESVECEINRLNKMTPLRFNTHLCTAFSLKRGSGRSFTHWDSLKSSVYACAVAPWVKLFTRKRNVISQWAFTIRLRDAKYKYCSDFSNKTALVQLQNLPWRRRRKWLEFSSVWNFLLACSHPAIIFKSDTSKMVVNLLFNGWAHSQCSVTEKE